jgi:mono/diheme cytochrome c family protein
MTRTIITFLTAAALASCGGSKSSDSTTPPPTGDGSAVAMPDKSMDKPMEPMGPMKPAEPAEPAKPDPGKMKAELMASETAAYETAKPVFGKYCASCHTKAGKTATKKKLDHFSMDSYPFGGEHTKSIGNEIRKVLGIDGAKPTMPFDHPGSVKGEELATIKAWTEAWQASGKSGNHPVDPAEAD